MPSTEHEALVAALLESNPVESDSLSEQRENYRVMMTQIPLPDDVVLESETINSVEIDWIHPKQSRNDTVIIYLHGGGYAIGDSSCYQEVSSRLTQATGASVAIVNYRLAPENPFPAALDDSVAIFSGLLQRGLSPAHIAFVGDSAGGGLVLSTLMKLKQLDKPQPACAICFSPWTDLAQTGASNRDTEIHDPLVNTDVLAEMASMYAGSNTTHPLASPLYGEYEGLPPLQIHVGTREILRDDARRFYHKAKAHGVNIELFEEPGLIHIWPVIAPQAPESITAMARCANFISQHC